MTSVKNLIIEKISSDVFYDVWDVINSRLIDRIYNKTTTAGMFNMITTIKSSLDNTHVQ